MPLLVSLNNQPPLDLPVLSCTWSHSSTRESGSAEILVPWRSPAYASSHIVESYATPVTIYSRLGRWDGIVMRLVQSAAGVVLQCLDLTHLLGAKLTARTRTFIGLTAGAIARQVINQSFAGLAGPGLSLGTFVQAAPVLGRYSVTGGTVADVIADLQARTGQEFSISARTFNWLPKAAPLYGTLLCEGAHLVGIERTIDFEDQIATVISYTDAGQSASARATRSAGPWQRELSASTNSIPFRVRALEVAHELNQRWTPPTTLTAELRDTSTHWASLREGMTVECFAPTAGLSGQTATYRLLARTYTEGARTLGLRLWHLPKPAALGFNGMGQEIPNVVRGQDADAYNQVYQSVQAVQADSGFVITFGFSDPILTFD